MNTYSPFESELILSSPCLSCWSHRANIEAIKRNCLRLANSRRLVLRPLLKINFYLLQQKRGYLVWCIFGWKHHKSCHVFIKLRVKRGFIFTVTDIVASKWGVVEASDYPKAIDHSMWVQPKKIPCWRFLRAHSIARLAILSITTYPKGRSSSTVATKKQWKRSQ